MPEDEARLRAGANPMARAWSIAASELGIRLVCPLLFRARGIDYLCTGLVVDFGGPSGTVIVSRYDSLPEDVFDAADEAGFFTSGLSPSYEVYDRAAFASALSDWGWFGEPTKVPSWFTGRVGAHGG